MDEKTKGAWIIHHSHKLGNVVNVSSDYEQIIFAGKCGILLNSLSASDQISLDNNRIQALAKAVNISPRLELSSLLSELERQRLIDLGKEGISVLGLTTSQALEYTGTIYNESKKSNVENAAINIAERVSELPIKSNDAIEIITDLQHITSKESKELLNQFNDIGFVDSEFIGDQKILFNGNLFRKENISKINGVLSTLSTIEEGKVKNLMENLKNSGCISVEIAKKITGSNLFSKLIGIGFIDINTIGNESGAFDFVTLPAAFNKFSSSVIDDAFDLAKIFVTSLTYGMTASTYNRGRITMIEALMKRLIQKGHG